MNANRFDSIVVFGEVLFDVFPRKKRVLGGAPFNVACHLSGFGLDPVFISKIGNDDPGREVVRKMDSRGLSAEGLQRDDDLMTGVVKVKIEDGEPSYEIKDNVAFDFIEKPPAELIDPSKLKLFYHGSLAARNSVSSSTLYALAQEQNMEVFCDINLREPWWSKGLVKDILGWCSYLKVNQDELEELCLIEGIGTSKDIKEMGDDLRQRYPLKCLIVTLGSKGAMLFPEGEEYIFAPSPEVSDFKDSVGAGDSFSSVSLLGIIKGWSWNEILTRSVTLAAEICANDGAVPADNQIYEKLREDWGL